MTRNFTHTVSVLCWLLAIAQAAAQPLFGNEWIDYERAYLRIPVVETGMYKITGRELAAYGIPVDSILPSGLRLFAHGVEQAIEVAAADGEPVGGAPSGGASPGEASRGFLGMEGYIVFYGQRNDGTADSALYTSPGAMPHPYYNLYSDTTVYFLSWDNSTKGLRTHFPEAGAVTDSSAWHWAEDLQVFSSHYLPGRFFPPGSDYENGSLLTAYDEGEGWTGPPINRNAPFKINRRASNLFRHSMLKISCEMLLAGWTDQDCSLELRAGNTDQRQRKVTAIHLRGRQVRLLSFELTPEDFDAHGQVTLTLLLTGGGQASVSYLRLRYPQSGIVVAPPPMHVLPARVVRFQRINPQTDYLIITHPLLRGPAAGRDPVMEYAQYRASELGGGYKPAIVYNHELFDQFHAGQPGPQGIRNAIRWLHAQGKLKMVLLAGRSVDPQKARKMKDAWQTDLVPNAGWPGSDVALTMCPNDSILPVAIGRINANHAGPLLAYLRKVQAMEAEPASASWRKRILHLSGGRSLDELTLFKSYMHSFESKLKNSPLAAHVTSLSKLTDDPVEQIPIDGPVNSGIALITLFGHSAIDLTDIDIGHATDPARNYQNHPRYPAVIVNGCAAGSIFYSNEALSNDWVLSPDNGAVLFLAHTFNGPSTSLKRYTDIFYEVLADAAFTAKPFGIIQQEAIRRNMQRPHHLLDRVTTQQMLLHGDPAIRIFPDPHAAESPDSMSGPDAQAPAMLVTCDGRPLADGDAISPKPVFSIRIFDDDVPLANNDTSLIAVWIKKQCTGCTDWRVPLRQAHGRKVNGDYYAITLPLDLQPGHYTLTVQCRDPAGHSAAPYRIRFDVPEEPGSIAALVSPNPSGRWFKCTVRNHRQDGANVEWTVTNPLGTIVLSRQWHCPTGTSECFWAPGLLSPGVYYSRVAWKETGSSPAVPIAGGSAHLLYSP